MNSNKNLNSKTQDLLTKLQKIKISRFPRESSTVQEVQAETLVNLEPSHSVNDETCTCPMARTEQKQMEMSSMQIQEFQQSALRPTLNQQQALLVNRVRYSMPPRSEDSDSELSSGL